MLDERPDAASQIAGLERRWLWRFLGLGLRLLQRRLRGLFFGLLEAGGHITRRHEPHQVLVHGIGHVKHDHALRLVGPDACEVGLLIHNTLGFQPPARIDVDALPVVPPAGRRLIEAAVPGDLVTTPVLDHAGFLVKDAVRRDGFPVRIARDGHLHIEKPPCDHPGQQFQRIG